MNFLNKKYFILFTFFLSISFAYAAPAFAAAGDVGTDGWQLVNCGNKGSGSECGWKDLIILANNIVNFIVFAATLFGVLAFCYAGFLYITAGGEGGKIEQAHGIFKAVLTGMMFILCGWLLIATILKILVADADNANIKGFVDFSSVQTLGGQTK